MRLCTFFWLLVLLSALSISSLIYPANPLTSVTGAISQFCGGMQGILPVAGMLMVLIGAVVYAAGQVLGAETRARANVWATAAIVGALVAMLIVAITPTTLEIVYGKGKVSCDPNATPPPPNCGALTCSGSTPKCCCASINPSCISQSSTCPVCIS